ncbi:ImmA/IrrE family metallo-endopeptidase [Algibacter pectinivorans]|uniref:Zn-dependent peptidase ImmA, M78 family n=1 Tax=Algibacter pectinivorans TaxID=870482 RepID=A0A1I1QPB2_9FLAO|nr:ImmA/IrrE family metallo-endopeptidase [Algibacter pectinivorans]SFD23857.1 Zn-dependent peptidase ImmA, M78 family [Algibacter pectinivorans]
MNTVKIGDKFEDKSYDLIVKAIENEELGISKSTAKVQKKVGYYSKDREKEIIFDLSIEIWPKNAKRYTLLYLIECKSSPSGHNVPVDDVEEFNTKINQVAGGGVKGIMITDNKFQSGGLTFAKNKRMMLIEVDKDDNHSIILHRTDKDNKKEDKKDADSIFFKFIKKTLGLKKVKGLKRLSAVQIENLALPILQKYNDLYSSIKIDEFIEHLKSEYDLKFDFTQDLETVNGKKIEGFYDIENKAILIDKSVLFSEKFPFVLGHELGHFFLHSNLKVNQERYDDFADSEYDFFTDRHNLVNDRNWIEWQANKFSISLFLPKVLFLPHLIAYRKSIGISRPEHIYLDEQTINKQDYYKTVDYLSDYFGISKTAVKFRIEELNLITYAKLKDDLRSVVRRTFFE